MAIDAIPLYEAADRLTVNATAALVAQTFAKPSAAPLSGPLLNTATDGSNISCATCGAGQRALGVVLTDQATVGGKTKVITEGIVPVTAGTGGLTAGQEVESDATGQAIAFSAGIKLGLCVIGATAGNPAYVKLNV